MRRTKQTNTTKRVIKLLRKPIEKKKILKEETERKARRNKTHEHLGNKVDAQPMTITKRHVSEVMKLLCEKMQMDA